jgi:hypothetical protein
VLICAGAGGAGSDAESSGAAAICGLATRGVNDGDPETAVALVRAAVVCDDSDGGGAWAAGGRSTRSSRKIGSAALAIWFVRVGRFSNSLRRCTIYAEDAAD